MIVCIINIKIARVADPVHFRPDPDPANQNFKPDPGSGSCFKKKHIFHVPHIFCMVSDNKIKKCHLKCPHLETFVVEKCFPVMKFENLKKLNLQIMVLYNFI